MEFFGKHATLRQLSRYADEDLEAAELRRVEAHLRDCHRCRGELAFMRKIGLAVRDVSSPRPPGDLLHRIEAARAGGQRVILPAVPPPVPARGRKLALVSLALLLAGALAVGSLALFSPDARAGASTLTFEFQREEAAPRSIQLEYRGAFGLTEEQELRLRGRYRTASQYDDTGTPIEAVLTRSALGAHQASISLPPAAVYAFFAVEDLRGRTIDTNAGRFWEILATDDNGFPVLEALRQKFLVVEDRDWVAALETAHRMTELYPDRAEGWWHRFSYERELASGAALADLIDFHRKQLANLERASLTHADPDARQLGALIEYARALEDEDALARLYDRLEDAQPGHSLSVRRRVAEAFSAFSSDPPRLLEALEREWRHSGPVEEFLAQAGYQTARRLGEPESITTWTDRYLQVFPSRADRAALEMLEIDGLRTEAMRRVRRELLHLERADGAARDLAESTQQHERAVGLRRARLLAGLGAALAAEGHDRAALDTLRLAAADVWDLETCRKVADAELALGDSLAAIELYARIIADPLTPATESEALPGVVGATTSAAEWESLVARGERQLEESLAIESLVRTLPPDFTLTDMNDRPSRLSGEHTRGPTVLVYWTPRSPPPVAVIDELEEAHSVLSGAGVPLLLVLRQPISPDPGRILEENGPKFGVLLDPEGQLLGEFDTWLDRQHLVLDTRGRLHLQHGTLADAMRQALLEARRIS